MPQKIEEDYAEVDRLADEKLRLAQRMVALIARARARLDHDLSKVLILQGDLDPSQQNTFVMTGRNPVQQINESLRHAMTLADVPPAAPVAPTPAPPMKRAFFIYFAFALLFFSPARCRGDVLCERVDTDAVARR